MNRNEYLDTLNNLKDVNHTNLVTLGKWVDKEALPWLWEEFGGILLETKPKHPLATNSVPAQKLKPLNNADAVRQGLISSVSERKKQPEPSFYKAQLTMLDSEA